MSRNRIFSMLFAAILLALGPGLSHAADKDDGKRQAPSIDAITGKVLNAAIEALNNQQYDQAIAALSKLDLEKLSPYVRSRVEQIYANIDSNRENYKGAREHFQKAIDAGGLNDVEIQQIKYVIAHLYMVEGDWKKGVQALEDWFRTAKNPNAGAYYLLAVAYYQLTEYQKALTAAQKAVELSDKPTENRLQLVLALQLQLQRYKDSLPTLETLISVAPGNKTYWIQLSSIYAQLQDYDDATAVMQIAYSGGILHEESDYLRLADLLMYQGVPYRAATVLTDELKSGHVKGDSKTYEKLANAWISAREYQKAIPPLQKAAEDSKDGDLFMRLGQVHVQLAEWSQASDAFKRAIEKGGLKDTGDAYIMMGMSLYNLKKYSDARDWFKKALPFSKQNKTARGYIQLIDSQKG